MKKLFAFFFILNASCNLLKVSKINGVDFEGVKGKSFSINANYMNDTLVKIKIWHSKNQESYNNIKTIDVTSSKFFNYEKDITFSSLKLSSYESNYIYTSGHDSNGNEITISNKICWGTGC